MAGGRPRRRLAARPHPPEQACGGGRFARLCFPPRRAGLVHLDAVAGRRAQQAAGVRHPPAGGCRLVTQAVGPTKSLLNEHLGPGSVGNQLFLCTTHAWKPAAYCWGNLTKVKGVIHEYTTVDLAKNRPIQKEVSQNCSSLRKL